MLTDAGYATPTARVDRELHRWTHALDQRPAHLVHGDLGDGEIFIEANGDLRGVVDWGGAIAADPLYEFARFVAGGPADDPRPQRLLPGLIDRYRDRTGDHDVDSHWHLLDLYRAENALSNAAWAIHFGFDSWVPGLVEQATASTAVMVDPQSN